MEGGNNPVGRPKVYDATVADYICQQVSEGRPLAQVCREDGMPDRTTVYQWIEKDKDFCQRFERAREAGADAIADDCLDIADDTSGDTIQTEFGPAPDKEWIMRSKLRVETRLKLLSKWHPKKYGDKLELDGKMNNSHSIAPELIQTLAERLNGAATEPKTSE